ncbi:hypothetical protein LEP1GSC107_1512 [Leptospira interrogans serovar Grippotyphosa str. UI 12769]|nr:hypothetical protein LEP1GSC077_2813 [Leptospira interrogans str. C10069]EKQ45758.1 hypothetical protein LEP1GSC026_1619 [Leptospira interrogans str. 2002000623]EKR43865.1 hypothetical protein LEP1GSC097_1078 [Leptospira interrogans serovar Grippotyphosa str. UI 08368]EMK15133.1 hypothetical protein LEP1GSC075_2335 [Leptospira interrogans str. Kito]EMN65059.1 hypothetical protein LEP1GSC098_4046 [Leptospira interrogans serovar Grippotyphosa str. UI 08434]EMN86783.1 hypothetical protein LEP1
MRKNLNNFRSNSIFSLQNKNAFRHSSFFYSHFRKYGFVLILNPSFLFIQIFR